MLHPDLNLLVTLDVLLSEGSVARAAKRLRLSPSAMSRALRDCGRRPAIRCWCGPGEDWCQRRGRWNCVNERVGWYKRSKPCCGRLKSWT